MSERSIQLEEIPGLLTIKKEKHTRVTQVHGSMWANVAAKAKSKESKEQRACKDIAKEEAEKRKEEIIEQFIKCTCHKKNA